MPKARKRKAPVTVHSHAERASSSNPHSSRTLIRRFHVLLKQQAHLQGTEDTKSLEEVESAIEELGGLAQYQRMSSIGQGNDRGGGSEKVLISWLREMGMSSRNNNEKLRLLEVGALKPDNYSSCISWIDATPMDLRSRHPLILEQDFLLMDSEGEHREKWSIVSLSLVVNFVPKAKNRGRMLSMAFQMLVPGGLLFLALPLPCVENSRYLTFEHLRSLMSAIGFKEIHERWKKSGKMAYWLYQKSDEVKGDVRKFHKKTVFRQGNRNNFTIVL